MDYIESNWSKPNFNVADFSIEMGYSKSQLYRKLKNLTGKSSNNFIREFRLHKALSLLHKQRGNISEIAYAIGHSNPQYFSKWFKSHCKMSPSEYILKNKSKY